MTFIFSMSDGGLTGQLKSSKSQQTQTVWPWYPCGTKAHSWSLTLTYSHSPPSHTCSRRLTHTFTLTYCFSHLHTITQSQTHILTLALTHSISHLRALIPTNSPAHMPSHTHMAPGLPALCYWRCHLPPGNNRAEAISCSPPHISSLG